MLPMIALRKSLGTSFAADTTHLAPVTANKIALIAAPFALTENLDLGSLTFATFTGSAPIAGTAGAQGVGTDPLTLDQVVTNLAPAGGWRYVCTVAPGSPETIYGYALTDNAGAVLLAVEILPSPIPIQSIGDEVDLGAVTFNFVAQPVS